MKVLSKLKNELSEAEENNYERLIKTLKELILTVESYSSDKKILDYMENIIKSNGKKIATLMKKGKIEEMEKLFYQQTVYNTYYSEMVYDRYRPIYYEVEDEKKKWDIDEISLVFTVETKKD